MSTEMVNERFIDIDLWSTREAVDAMFEGQLSAVAAVRPLTSTIAQASEKASSRLISGGRLVYIGAGTSGRIAVQDGVELLPTYGWPSDKIAFVIAGGTRALSESAEKAEDEEDASVKELIRLNVCENDVIIGVAASGRTPFTVAALKYGKSKNALTIGVASNPNTPVITESDFGLCAETGSELVAGSTRMKAGTAQKVILNLFSTATMIRCGRVYKGLMVNMVISNDKLRHRATEIVKLISGATEQDSDKAVGLAGGDIPSAILISMGLSFTEAQNLLQGNVGNLKQVVEKIRKRTSNSNNAIHKR